MRIGETERITKETAISCRVTLDGKGEGNINTPINFLSHMLNALSKHGLFDIKIAADGDMEIDQHHTVEDLGIVLGDTFKNAMGDKMGIARAGCFTYMMDDALVEVVVDFGGRPYLLFDASFKRRYCGDFDTDLTEHFFESFANSAMANVSIRQIKGKMDHHILEAMFKAFGKSLMQACSILPRAKLPSTKGVIA